MINDAVLVNGSICRIIGYSESGAAVAQYYFKSLFCHSAAAMHPLDFYAHESKDGPFEKVGTFKKLEKSWKHRFALWPFELVDYENEMEFVPLENAEENK